MNDVKDVLSEAWAQEADKRAMRAFGDRLRAWLVSEACQPGFDYIGTLIVLNSVVARQEALLAAQVCRPNAFDRLSAHHAELAASCRLYHFNCLKENTSGKKVG